MEHVEGEDRNSLDISPTTAQVGFCIPILIIYFGFLILCSFFSIKEWRSGSSTRTRFFGSLTITSIARIIELFVILLVTNPYNQVSIEYAFRMAGNVSFFLAFLIILWQWQVKIFKSEKKRRMLMVAVVTILFMSLLFVVIFFELFVNILEYEYSPSLPRDIDKVKEEGDKEEEDNPAAGQMIVEGDQRTHATHDLGILIYGIISLIISIYYLVYGIRFLLILREGDGKLQDRKDREKKQSLRVIAITSVFTLCFGIRVIYLVVVELVTHRHAKTDGFFVLEFIVGEIIPMLFLLGVVIRADFSSSKRDESSSRMHTQHSRDIRRSQMAASDGIELSDGEEDNDNDDDDDDDDDNNKVEVKEKEKRKEKEGAVSITVSQEDRREEDKDKDEEGISLPKVEVEIQVQLDE